MRVRTGVDIVHIPTFSKTLEQGGDLFLERVFTQSEPTEKKTIESLAGLYAAKEAVVKALGLGPDSWHKIEISHSENGRPLLKVSDDESMSNDLSITHHQDYAFASVVFLYE